MMRAFLQEMTEALSRSLDDLLYWVFSLKMEMCLIPGVGFKPILDEARQREQARRLRVAYNRYAPE